MKTSMARTSTDAYYQMIAGPKLGEQQQTIVKFLAHNCHRDFTRAEIAHNTGIKLQSVCGRVNELVDQQIIIQNKRRKCGITGVSANPLRLAPAQTELFA